MKFNHNLKKQNKKQFIFYGEENASQETISCGVPQRSKLGPLLSRIFVNNLQYAKNMLNPITLADDISFFPHIVT